MYVSFTSFELSFVYNNINNFNKEMNDIKGIVKSLDNSGLLIKGITKAIKNESKEEKSRFFSML